MKKILTYTSAYFVALLMFTGLAVADQPNLVVDGNFHVVYDELIEISDIDTSRVAQFNHNSSQDVVLDVQENSVVKDVKVDVAVIGNNASIEINDDLNIIQGNQVGNLNADTSIVSNDIGGDFAVNVTAVGNNANVTTNGTLALDNVQFNKESPISVDVAVTDNSFGPTVIAEDSHHNHGKKCKNKYTSTPIVVDVETTLSVEVAAIGNNLSVDGGLGSITSMQLNRDSPISLSANISNNTGSVGSMSTSLTNVGNNLSVSVNNPL